MIACIRVLILLSVLLSAPAWSATYYVATTGNDSTGTGAIDNPWRNPQKCAETPITQGDLCIVRDGTYTDTDTIVVFANTVQGTALQPITIRSENPRGAVISLPTTASATSSRGFYINRPYFIIEGFAITGGSGDLSSASLSITGILLTSSATGAVVRRNYIHDIGRDLCTNSASSLAGISSQGTSQTIEYNEFYHNGRLRDGESGCTTDKFQHDHGIYALATTNLTIRRNIFRDVNRGFPIQIFKSGGTTTNLKIENNSFYDPTPSVAPSGCIILSNTINTASIKNNLFQGCRTSAINTFALTASSVSITHNRQDTDDTSGDNIMVFPLESGITTSNNTDNSAAGFADAANGDLTLASGSNAINAGTAIAGVSCTDTCDQGAFETFRATAATADVDLIDVTYNPAHGPIQVGGATGHSVDCTTSCGTLTVANATKLSSSDSIARLQISGWTSGECLTAYNITQSFNAAIGTLTDSANIGGTLNQPVHSYGPLAVTNNCSEAGSPTPPTPSHILYELDGDEADTSGNNLPGTRTGGSYVAGKYGQALQGVAGTTVNVTSQYGDGVDPSGQDLTIVVGYEVPAGAELLTRTVMGAAFSSGNNLYVSTIGGTWQVGAQNSGVSIGTPSNLPVRAGYNRLFLQVDSTANTVTLTVDNVTGTGGAAKSITPYTLGGDIAFGLPAGFNASVAGAGKWDKAAIYTSLIDPETDWLAWEPSSAPSVGSYSQAGHQWYLMTQDGAGAAIPYLAPNATAKVVAPGGALLKTQTDCTGGAACGSMGEKLWYRRNGGEKQIVPDTFTSDDVSFWGSNTFPEMYLGQADCCITGALTENHGTTQILNVAQPTIELANDHSITRMSALRWGPNASGVYCFEEQNQNGTELTSVTPAGGACMEVIGVQAAGVH